MDKSSQHSSEQEFRVDSWMQSVVPSIPRGYAVVCLILNIVIPGLGTVTGGILSCFCGRPRFEFRPTRHRCPIALMVVGIGVLQLASVAFFLVGWLWSIIWGFLMVNLSGPEFRKLPPLPCPTPSTAGTRKSIGRSRQNSIIQIQENDTSGKKNFARLLAKAKNPQQDSGSITGSITDLRGYYDDDGNAGADGGIVGAAATKSQHPEVPLGDGVDNNNIKKLEDVLNGSNDDRVAIAEIEPKELNEDPARSSAEPALIPLPNDDLVPLATDGVTSSVAGSNNSLPRQEHTAELVSVVSSETDIRGDKETVGESVASLQSNAEHVGTESSISKSEPASLPEVLSSTEQGLPTDGVSGTLSSELNFGVPGDLPGPSAFDSGKAETGPKSSVPHIESIDTDDDDVVHFLPPPGGGTTSREATREPTDSFFYATDDFTPLESVRSEHPPVQHQTGSPAGGDTSSDPGATLRDKIRSAGGNFKKFKPITRGQTSDDGQTVTVSHGTESSDVAADGKRDSLSRVGLPEFASVSLPNFLPVAATKSFFTNCYRSVAGMVHKASTTLGNKQTSESCDDLLASGGPSSDSQGRESFSFRSSAHRIFSRWKRRALTVHPPSTLEEESEGAPPQPPSRPPPPPPPRRVPHSSFNITSETRGLRQSRRSPQPPGGPASSPSDISANKPAVANPRRTSIKPVARPVAPPTNRPQANHVAEITSGQGETSRRAGANLGTDTKAIGGGQGQHRGRPNSISHGTGPPHPVPTSKPPAQTNTMADATKRPTVSDRDPLPLNAGKLHKTPISNKPPAINALKIKQTVPNRKPRTKMTSTYHYKA